MSEVALEEQSGDAFEIGPKSSLAIIEEAFRGGLEEQYANIVWLSECMRLMKANHNILLKGPAVTCAFKGQERKSLTIAGIEIPSIGHLPDAVTGVMEKGARIWVLERDLEVFGPGVELLDGIERTTSAAALVAAHEKAWFW